MVRSAREKKKKKPAKNESKRKLNLKWLLFCRYFTQPGSDTFNNGTISYALAFGYKLDKLSRERTYDLPEDNPMRKIIKHSEYDRACHACAQGALDLMRKPEITTQIRDNFYNLFGDEKSIDARHSQIIYQQEDHSTSLAAIREANRLKKRINDEPTPPPNAQPITRIEIVMPGAAPSEAKTTV